MIAAAQAFKSRRRATRKHEVDQIKSRLACGIAGKEEVSLDRSLSLADDVLGVTTDLIGFDDERSEPSLESRLEDATEKVRVGLGKKNVEPRLLAGCLVFPKHRGLVETRKRNDKSPSPFWHPAVSFSSLLTFPIVVRRSIEPVLAATRGPGFSISSSS